MGIVVRGPAIPEDKTDVIYSNEFNNLVVATEGLGKLDNYAQNWKGLQFRCNDYNNNIFNIGVFDGSISDRQGECGDINDPAGNRFNHQCISFENDFIMRNPSQDIIYSHHEDNVTTPQCYTEDPGTNPGEYG
ncbi:MAG: hypothetical protein ABEH43_00390, partial [Flavobacteriales bacterium]